MVFSGVSGGSATRWKHVYGKAIQRMFSNKLLQRYKKNHDRNALLTTLSRL